MKSSQRVRLAELLAGKRMLFLGEGSSNTVMGRNHK